MQAINALSTLDVSNLSFVQLQRLLKVLRQSTGDVEAESARRAEEDSAGDTVNVPSPTI